jgi:signal transduction histidine kinase
MVRLWVEDRGIGISPDAHKVVFEIFQRLHTEAQYEGSGIGLAIVRKAVERMGGHVGVESTPGQGSRFWLELPQAYNEPN